MTRYEFYNSKAWRRLSKAFLTSKHYICERCGQPAEIAHHKTHITPRNVNDPAITLNAENLESVCLACHNTEHFSASHAITAGLVFTPEGGLREE